MSFTPPAEPLEIPVMHAYNRPPAGTASRSPCPALNALANHGYIRRDGRNLTFFEVFRAISFVYNFSYPLSFLLTLGGFITCGKLSWTRADPALSRSRQAQGSWPSRIIALLVSHVNALLRAVPTYTLDLDALAARGPTKIAHDGSFVHPNGVPSTAPDPGLVGALLASAGGTRDTKGQTLDGMGFTDIARYHAARVRASPHLDSLHAQIAGGECALLWEVFRAGAGAKSKPESVVPASRLKQWFGDERLPDGWVRPDRVIGLFHTRRIANLIEQLASTRSK